MKLGLMAWGGRLLLGNGWPARLVTTYGGVGDELMTAAALRELQERGGTRGMWVLTRYPELWPQSGIEARFIPWDIRVIRLAERLRRPVTHLGYIRPDAPDGVQLPLEGHAIATFCRQLGVRGRVALKPLITLTAAERSRGARVPRQVVVQSSNSGGLAAIVLKRWPTERFQAVVDALRADGFSPVQLGSPSEPALEGALDLRGRTTLREAAAVLSQSLLLVGVVGGLMHMARAVDCPAVIVYGGREDTALAGYSANANLVALPPCAPCYFRDHCPHDLACMDQIGAAAVIAEARRRLSRPAGPLPEDFAEV